MIARNGDGAICEHNANTRPGGIPSPRGPLNHCGELTRQAVPVRFPRFIDGCREQPNTSCRRGRRIALPDRRLSCCAAVGAGKHKQPSRSRQVDRYGIADGAAAERGVTELPCPT
eukprot:scaffold137874_cov30-Tisochrysis_lutea.AAC.3